MILGKEFYAQNSSKNARPRASRTLNTFLLLKKIQTKTDSQKKAHIILEKIHSRAALF